jgi:ABC-2 type transport system ATP-binding protein
MGGMDTQTHQAPPDPAPRAGRPASSQRTAGRPAPSQRTAARPAPSQRTCAAVVVNGLSKSFGAVQAVRGISFAVEEGEVFALLGPNGAGKTTTLEILEGFRTPDSGRAEVLGADPGSRAGRRDLAPLTGLVLQEVGVERYLTVRETVARNAGYYPVPRDVSEVISLVGLAGQERRLVRSLSGGQKRRLDLALGIIGNPRLLFLDEPTTGFDPSARRGAWHIVRDLRAAGTTILLTTHYMDEAQALADRVAVMADGQIVALGTPSAIGGRDTARVLVCFSLPDGCTLAELPVAARLSGGERLVAVETADPTQTLRVLTTWAQRRGVTLDRLSIDRPSLEDIYLRLTDAHAPGGATEGESR